MAGESNSCRTCKHLYGYYEPNDYNLDYPIKVYGCSVRPTVANLRQFPFRQTQCGKWELAGQPITEGASPPVRQIRL